MDTAICVTCGQTSSDIDADTNECGDCAASSDVSTIGDDEDLSLEELADDEDDSSTDEIEEM